MPVSRPDERLNAEKNNELYKISSEELKGSVGASTQSLIQKDSGHSWPSGTPPPSVSGSSQFVPISCSIVSGIPSPSVSVGLISSLGLF